MRIIHRVSTNSSPEIRRELTELGIVVNVKGYLTFEVSETDERWSRVMAWIVRRGAFDFVYTKFSERELDEAAWLELMPSWHHGYPQPEEERFGFLSVTYDLQDYCAMCGIGAQQKAAFRMKSEPKWGKRGLLQLNWVFDEFFVTPILWEAVFRKVDVKTRPVWNVEGATLKTVLQLNTEGEVATAVSGLPAEACQRCKRVKYLPVARGPFPGLRERPKGHLVKTKEYFGSGTAADKRVLISQELARALRKSGARGVSFRPVGSERRTL